MTPPPGQERTSPPPRLARAGVLNTFIGLFSAALTFLSLALIVSRFGGSAGSDAYFYLLSLVTVGTALLGGILSAVLLPQLVEVRVKSGLALVSALASQLLAWLLLLCALLALMLALFHSPFYAFASRFSAEQVQAQRAILGWLGPLLVFSVLAEYLRILLLGVGRYAAAACMALVTPATLVAVLLLDHSLSEAELATALAFSRGLMVAAAMFLLMHAGMRLLPRLGGGAPLARFGRISAPYAAASVVTQLSVFFFDYMASGLGTGVLTAVTLAHRIFALPLMLLVTPLLEIARVRFAELRAMNDEAAFQRQYDQLSVLVLYVAIPAAALLFIFPGEIVALLFQRGAFNAQDAEIAAACLQVLALSVPLGCFFTLNGRVVESFQQLNLPSFLGSIGNLCLMALTYVLVGAMGFIGIPLSRLLVDLGYLLPFGLWMLHRHRVHVNFVSLGQALLRAGLACAIPVSLVLWLQSSLTASGSAVPAGWALAAVVTMGVLYAVLVWALDPQARLALRSLRGGA
jgi:putative peptidoglycan lipid II flippase